MKTFVTIVLALFFGSSCATTPFTQTTTGDVCGDVGPLTIHANPGNGFIHCPEAIALAQASYNLLKAKAGPLREHQDVLYTYAYLEFVDFDFHTPFNAGPPGTIPTGPGPIGTVGITYSDRHLIAVREMQPRALFHELLHAYMHENTSTRVVDGHKSGSVLDHKTICQTHSWWRAEADYDRWPRYCYDEGGVK